MTCTNRLACISRSTITACLAVAQAVEASPPGENSLVKLLKAADSWLVFTTGAVGAALSAPTAVAFPTGAPSWGKIELASRTSNKPGGDALELWPLSVLYFSWDDS